MAIDWSLARQPNVLAMALDGYEQGRKLRQEEDSKKALATLFGGNALAPNPAGGVKVALGAPNSSIPTLDPILSPGGGIGGGHNAGEGVDYSALTPEDLRTAITLRSSQREQQAAQAKAQGERLQQLGRLLNHATDETTYQQSLAAARQIGLDVSGAPTSFDPNWVNQQRLVLQAYEKDGGQQISGLAKELSDAGYKPGTPEFLSAMKIALQGKYAPTYTDEQGNMRQGQLPPLPGAQTAPQANPEAILRGASQAGTITPEEAATVRQSLGPNGGQAFENWLRQNRISIAKTINGQTYYQVNGQWYDNPEGR